MNCEIFIVTDMLENKIIGAYRTRRGAEEAAKNYWSYIEEEEDREDYIHSETLIETFTIVE